MITCGFSYILTQKQDLLVKNSAPLLLLLLLLLSLSATFIGGYVECEKAKMCLIWKVQEGQKTVPRKSCFAKSNLIIDKCQSEGMKINIKLLIIQCKIWNILIEYGINICLGLLIDPEPS